MNVFNPARNVTGCPCKDCEKRNPGCHDRCEMFAQWKAEMEKRKKAERLLTEHTINETAVREIWRKKRYHRQVHRSWRYED